MRYSHKINGDTTMVRGDCDDVMVVLWCQIKVLERKMQAQEFVDFQEEMENLNRLNLY